MEDKLVFDDDDPKFARGFEAGRVWGILSRIPLTRGLKVCMQKSNAEMALRMGEAMGREVLSEELEFEEGEVEEGVESGHMNITFGPAVEYEEA